MEVVELLKLLFLAMIYVRLITTIFLFTLLGLWALESGFIQSMVLYFAGLSTIFVLGFTSWYLSRWATTVILRPFSKAIPKHSAVLVTGCDSGLGQLTAFTLNRLGFFVFAGYNNPDDGRTFVKEASFPSRIKVLNLDITIPEHVTNSLEVVNQVMKNEHLHQLTALINCASVMKFGEIEFGPPDSIEDYEESMQVNCFGTIRVTKTFLPLIRESKGRIINVSSYFSRFVTPGSNAYSVSEAALSKFTEGLQLEMSKFGVKVIGIEPWLPMTDGKAIIESMNKIWESTPKRVRKSYGKNYFYQLLRFMDVFARFPLYVEPDKVVSVIVDNLIVAEPQVVSRVINPIIGFPLWIVNDILSWEFISFVRNWLFFWIFKLLSIEYMVGVRKV